MAKKSNNKKPATNKNVVGFEKKTNITKTETLIKVRFLNSPSAKYKIAGEIGHVKKVHPSQATEMVANGDAELVK